MDTSEKNGLENTNSKQTGADTRKPAATTVNRRDLLRLAVGAGAGFALSGLLDLPTVKAATEKLKVAQVTEFTTSCNFCSCGCGMVASVRDGKLIKLEGDFDHVVNGGSLCVKGMAMFPTHASPMRIKAPRYRAPGSDHWVDITWEEAVDRIARKIRTIRDQTWVATQTAGDTEVPVNRTDAIAFMGGAQNTNEECYLFQKAARLLGLPFVEHQARL
jgi:formate dehydrogenase major subunit